VGLSGKDLRAIIAKDHGLEKRKWGLDISGGPSGWKYCERRLKCPREGENKGVFGNEVPPVGDVKSRIEKRGNGWCADSI